MAIGSQIYKVNLNLSNFNDHYYDDFKLTLAKHPSENESRMMYRLLAFLYRAHKDLEFTKGLSDTDEPELWQKDAYTGELLQWIELGLPDEKRIRQACGKSKSVSVFTHQDKAIDWFDKIKGKLIKNDKVEIFHFNIIENGPIDRFVDRSMKLSCIIEDNIMYLGDDNERIGVEVIRAK